MCKAFNFEAGIWECKAKATVADRYTHTHTHTHDSVILTRNGDDAHDPLPYFAELTNGVPLDLLLNQSSDKKKVTPALVVAKTLSFESCREHEAHSWSMHAELLLLLLQQPMREIQNLYNTTTTWHINAATVTTAAAAAAAAAPGKLSAKLMWSPILQQWVSMILNQLVTDQLHCPLSLSLSLKALSFNILSLLSLSHNGQEKWKYF